MAFNLEGIQDLSNCTKEVAGTTSLTVGQLIKDNGSGYAVDAGVGATNITILGLVRVAADNSAGANGDISVTYTPLPPSQWLKGLTDKIPTAAMIGKLCLLQDGNTIDTDASPAAGVIGFKICAIVDATNKIVKGYLSL